MSISSNKDPRNEAARRHRGPAGWLAVVALALSGCASAPDAPEETGPPAAVLARFEAALEAMRAEDYRVAEPMLEALVTDWPELSGPPLNLAIVYSATGRDSDADAASRTCL